MSELPAGWTMTTVKELAGVTGLFVDGDWVESKDQDPNGNIRLLQLADIGDGHFLDKSDRWINEEAFERLRCTELKAGDVLIARMPEPLGRACLMPLIESRCITVVDVAALRVDSEFVDRRWAMHTINSPQIRAEITDGSSGTTRRRIARGRLGDFALSLPPREEQTRIANQLDTLLARINACTRRFDVIPGLLKRFRQAVLDLAASGAMTMGGGSDWPVVMLGQVIVEMRNGLPQKPTEQPSGAKILRISALRAGKLDLADHRYLAVSEQEEKQYGLRMDDLLFTRYNGSLEFVGVCASLVHDAPGYVYPDKLIRVRVRKDLVLPKFIEIVFGSKSIRQQIEGYVKSSAGQRGISGADLKGVSFRLAPLTEQLEIVRRVKALFKLADRIEASHAAAVTQAQRLAPLTLAKAFRGELVQQDPQDEPASALLQRIAEARSTNVKAPRGRPRTKKKETDAAQPDWSALPAAAWAANVQVDEHTSTALLTAVLKAWGQPMPQDQARLAALLCLNPRLLTAALPADHAAQWRRLVGAAAEPLPTRVAALQPSFNTPWRNAITKMRARGDLVESGSGPHGTWALGPDAARVDTAGWPDGRAGWVVHYLQTHGVEAVLPALTVEEQEFVHARAA